MLCPAAFLARGNGAYLTCRRKTHPKNHQKTPHAASRVHSGNCRPARGQNLALQTLVVLPPALAPHRRNAPVSFPVPSSLRCLTLLLKSKATSLHREGGKQKRQLQPQQTTAEPHQRNSVKPAPRLRFKARGKRCVPTGYRENKKLPSYRLQHLFFQEAAGKRAALCRYPSSFSAYSIQKGESQLLTTGGSGKRGDTKM